MSPKKLLAATSALLAAALGLDAAAPGPQDPIPEPDVHAEWLLTLPESERRFPSAKQCAQCHLNIYREWSTSQHAYAAISPMFHRFEQRINELASGTVGAFCVRCHISVGTALGEPREMPIYERAPVSQEGVTCVSCHRVEESFGKVNGARGLREGPITAPIVGSTGAVDLGRTIDELNLATTLDPSDNRTRVHERAIQNTQISKSEFCLSCHQVAVHPGIKLEVVWEQYRDSPARKRGASCQDCHMGATPGTDADGYATAPRAVVNGVEIKPGSRHTDHSFVGPGYSIAHPGIFPHNERSPDAFTAQRWLSFDWRAGWGGDEFEDRLARGDVSVEFPPEWSDISDRRDAWSIVDENLRRLEERNLRRVELMERSSHIDGPFFDSDPTAGRDLAFHYVVKNLSDGHNMPSGSLGAQPELWLNVALVGPDGTNLWESGWVDSRGDMGDLHSKDVIAGLLEPDRQLFNLQTKFLTTNLKGTDREMYLPVPFEQDQIPYIRPATTPNSVMNHPPFIRMEQRSIPPLGQRKARYVVPGAQLSSPGTYRLAVRLRSRAEPIYFMEFCNATTEMIREMNAQIADIHPYTVEFEVH